MFVREQQIETCKIRRGGLKSCKKALRGLLRSKVVGDQRAARWPGRLRGRPLTKVGHDCEAALPIQTEPRAAGREITAGKDLLIRPLAQGRGRPCVKLVAVGCQNQSIAGMNLPGEHQETQVAAPGGSVAMSGGAGKPPTDQPIGDRMRWRQPRCAGIDLASREP